MNRQWLLPAALVLACVILLMLWFSTAKDEDQAVSKQLDASAITAPLSILWRSGNAQRYRLLSESSMQMQATLKGPSSIRVYIQGELDTLTLETSADQALVGMQLSSIELKINDTMDAATNRALGVPFRVRFAANGMPLLFEFPASVSSEHRSILESLVRTFQLSLGSGDSWVTQETNGSGTYEAVYHRTGPAQLEKSKRSFSAVATGMISWSEMHSTESIRIEAGHDWIASMKVKETLRSDGQGGPAMSVSNQATLELQAGAQLAVTPDLWQFETAPALADSGVTRKRAVPDITAAEARAKILASIPELDAAKQGRLVLIHQLRDLLLVDESLPAVLLDVLKTEQLDDRTRADLYLVLEQAGTSSAQAVLVSVITDSSWSLKDGMRAIVALGGIRQPAAESISALWDTAQYGNADERQRMASSAAFALGSIGNTLQKADNPDYATLRSDLLNHALGAANVAQRSDFITALGNTNDPTLAYHVIDLLDDSEPAIRRAAALSLGTLGSDQVADRLVSHYRDEENDYVRGAIAESLQSWTQPTDSAMEMFRQTLQTQTDERTRYNIAILLGNNLAKFPENETVLREIMRTEPSKRIRQKVAEALASHNAAP